jgi:hypothetical protein
MQSPPADICSVHTGQLGHVRGERGLEVLTEPLLQPHLQRTGRSDATNVYNQWIWPASIKLVNIGQPYSPVQTGLQVIEKHGSFGLPPAPLTEP